MTSVDLVLPELHKGDATGNHTRLIQQLLKNQGISTRIVIAHKYNKQGVVNNSNAADANIITLNEWTASADFTILQHSITSQCVDHIIQKNIPIILNYHNVTPAKFFESWNPQFASVLEASRQQLDKLAPLTIRAIADSHFNAAELKALGIRDVKVVPVLWCLNTLRTQSPPAPSAIPADSGNILFVGRIAPNKCQHDLIKALSVLSQFRPKATLMLVGEPSPPAYQHALKNLTQHLGLTSQVTFTGKVSDNELRRHYESADVFLSASEHEGFGVPLVEAMSMGLPAVAYAAAAIPETLGGSGLLLNDKSPATLGCTLQRILSDNNLRKTLRDYGIESARRFDISATSEQMWNALQDLLEANR